MTADMKNPAIAIFFLPMALANRPVNAVPTIEPIVGTVVSSSTFAVE